MLTEWRVCPQCHDEFIVRSSQHRFCSAHCSWLSRYTPHPPAPVERACANPRCAHTFTATNPLRRYCTETCRLNAHQNRHYRAHAARKEAA